MALDRKLHCFVSNIFSWTESYAHPNICWLKAQARSLKRFLTSCISTARIPADQTSTWSCHQNETVKENDAQSKSYKKIGYKDRKIFNKMKLYTTKKVSRIQDLWKEDLLSISLTLYHFWCHPIRCPWTDILTFLPSKFWWQKVPWYWDCWIISISEVSQFSWFGHIHSFVNSHFKQDKVPCYELFCWSPAKVFLSRAPSSPLTLAANPKSVTFTRPS